MQRLGIRIGQEGAQAGLGGAGRAQGGLGRSQDHHRGRIAGLGRQDLGGQPPRLGMIAEAVGQGRQADQGPQVTGRQFERTPVAGLGGLQFAHGREHEATVAVGGGEVGSQGEGGVELGQRGLRLAEVLQAQTQGVARGGVLWRDLDRAPQPGQGLGERLGPLERQGAQVQEQRMLGAVANRLLGDGGRRLQIAAPDRRRRGLDRFARIADDPPAPLSQRRWPALNSELAGSVTGVHDHPTGICQVKLCS